MARRRQKKLPQKTIECRISRLSHEGRGIARDEDGKTQFIEAALPGELVTAKYVDRRSKFDELRAIAVIEAADERVTPPCASAAVCGGCSIQHMQAQAQISFKENVLREQFRHFGNLAPDEWVTPMTGPTIGYRNKARIGVRYLEHKNEVLIGFREKRSRALANIQNCEVLNPKVGYALSELRTLVRSLSVYQAISQFEVAIGDEVVALVMRHMNPLTEEDRKKLCSFAQRTDTHLYVQLGGPQSAQRLWPESVGDTEDRLHYALITPKGSEVTLAFHPTDFTQVNSDINQKMVSRAMEWLDVQPGERVLDLFCGLGNFTIPLATQAGEVVGIEGDDAMVNRGKENAKLNGLDNVEFYAANLQADFTKHAWAAEGFDKIVIDPPRSGALDIVSYLIAFDAKKIVYVSCNPSTLARDAGVMIEKGYRMVKAGVMDMFPHTSHVESIALFEQEL
jgi:23S rRNA (uracil1939-C5)-methyltransferase